MNNPPSPLALSKSMAWLKATRPKTLPVSIVPILVGTVLARKFVVEVNWMLSLFALLCSLSLQIGTNLINDALDFVKGADSESRLGPMRLTQAGALATNEVLAGGWICFALALLFGVPLILSGGWPILLLLIISIFSGYMYTGGPYPLAYYGLGDFFVFIYFGLVSTCVTFFLQTGTVNVEVFVASIQIGLLATVPIAINNLRDIDTDPIANKNTLAVRFGMVFSRFEISLLTLSPFFLGFYWVGINQVNLGIFPLIVLPAAIVNIVKISKTPPSKQYNDFLATSVLVMFGFGLSLIAGAWLE